MGSDEYKAIYDYVAQVRFWAQIFNFYIRHFHGANIVKKSFRVTLFANPCILVLSILTDLKDHPLIVSVPV